MQDFWVKKIDKHEVNVYLVNTGWSGGEYGIGKRMSIKATRTCINAILDGSINKCEFENFDIFNILIPKELNGVETKLLNPINAWADKKRYAELKLNLAKRFIENFKRYEDVKEGVEFAKAGPNL